MPPAGTRRRQSFAKEFMFRKYFRKIIPLPEGGTGGGFKLLKQLISQ